MRALTPLLRTGSEWVRSRGVGVRPPSAACRRVRVRGAVGGVVKKRFSLQLYNLELYRYDLTYESSHACGCGLAWLM